MKEINYKILIICTGIVLCIVIYDYLILAISKWICIGINLVLLFLMGYYSNIKN